MPGGDVCSKEKQDRLRSQADYTATQNRVVRERPLTAVTVNNCPNKGGCEPCNTLQEEHPSKGNSQSVSRGQNTNHFFIKLLSLFSRV